MELDHGVWQKSITDPSAAGHSFADHDDFESRISASVHPALLQDEPPSRLSLWLARLLGLEAFFVEPMSPEYRQRSD